MVHRERGGLTKFELALLFTGHMIDLPDRAQRRFPPRLEQQAADAIRNEIARAAKNTPGPMVGIASGARGGDILFLEACRGAGIPIRMVLPFELERFLDSSVRGVPSGDWEARFDKLWYGLTGRDREVAAVPLGENPYDHCNRRMLGLAGELAGRFRLIALRDRKELAPKPGGTASFVGLVRHAHGEVAHIDTARLLRKLRA